MVNILEEYDRCIVVIASVENAQFLIHPKEHCFSTKIDKNYMTSSSIKDEIKNKRYTM